MTGDTSGALDDARRRVLALLASNPAPLDEFLHRSSIGFAVVGTDLTVLYMNDAQAHVVGYSPEEVIGRDAAEVSDPAAWPDIERFLRRALEGTTTADVVLEQDPRGPYGEPRRWRLAFYPLSEGGRVVAAAATLVNVSPHLASPRGLALRSRLLDLLARGSREGPTAFFSRVCELSIVGGHFTAAWIGAVTPQGLEIAASAGIDAARLAPVVAGLRLDPDDPMSQGPAVQSIATGAPRVHNAFATDPDVAPWHEWALENRAGSVASFPIHADGSVVAVLTLYAPEPGAFSEETVAVLGDISLILSSALQGILDEERRRSTQRDLERRDQMISAITEGIAVFDFLSPDHGAIYVSPGFEALTGYRDGEFLGRRLGDLTGPGTDQLVVAEQRRAVAEGRPYSAETLHYRKDGTAFWDNVSVTPFTDEEGRVVHFVAVLSDVTERHQLAERLAQSEKMQALGTLAAGIAHDFNNALLVVRGYASLLAGSDDPTTAEVARRIDAAVEQAATVSRRLLALGDAPTGRLTPCPVNELVESVVTSWTRRLAAPPDVVLDLAPDAPPALADRAMLQVALECLLDNAREALGAGGSISVSTAVADGALEGGARAVRLSVADTGRGMDATTRARALEPFFTTKSGGVGIGLPTAYGIAAQCGGTLEIDSAPDRGTRVHLDLPAGEPEAAPSPPASPVAHERRARVLLVEDLAEARALLARALRARGFDVFEASDGAEALELADELDAFDVLVTDVSMPRLGGAELAVRLCARQPGLRVVFTSGYPSEEVVRDERLAGVTLSFLAKPYLAEEMVREVDAILAAP